MPPIVAVGNKRELPGGIPILAWWEKVAGYEHSTAIDNIPWFDPLLEYLTPEAMRRIKAKALVWHDIRGEWPTDITCWWEVRQGRKAGYVPWSTTLVDARVDEEGTLHCGNCKARGTPSIGDVEERYPTGCKLCGNHFGLFELAPIAEEDIHVGLTN